MGVGGWEEKLRIRLNSAQFKLKLLVGAELGNNSQMVVNNPSDKKSWNKCIVAKIIL